MSMSVILFFVIAILSIIIETAIIVVVVRRDKQSFNLKPHERNPGFQLLGERFYYNGNLIEVSKPERYCKGCALKRKGCIIPYCFARHRLDQQEVIFKRIKQ